MLILWAFWKSNNELSSGGSTKVSTHADAYPALDLKDPQPSFDCLRYVVATGGDEITRQVAIVWIDEEARRNIPLTTTYEKFIHNLLETNGHNAWGNEYRQWIFNSAFNLLQQGKDQERLTRLLLKLAVYDRDPTMRLYALQHIGSQKNADRLSGSLADQAYTTLQELIAEPDGQVAGTAIALLAQWKSENINHDIKQQAVEIAADASRPIDVRVTALHAAEAKAIDLARTLATDLEVHIMLRKAAIASIGRHGNESDYPYLEKLIAENFRIAQAAEPALQVLRHRITNPTKAPELIPY